MSRKLTTMILLALFFAGGTVLAASAGNVSPQQAAAMLKQNQKTYLLDVRTQQEYRQGHLADAHLIPIDQVERRLAEIPKDRPIVVYCAVGARSASVFGFLARRGFPEVYNLDGGIVAWMQQGYPVVR